MTLDERPTNSVIVSMDELTKSTISELRAENKQLRKDWDALLVEIALTVGDRDDREAAELGEIEEFDPWHALRNRRSQDQAKKEYRNLDKNIEKSIKLDDLERVATAQLNPETDDDYPPCQRCNSFMESGDDPCSFCASCMYEIGDEFARALLAVLPVVRAAERYYSAIDLYATCDLCEVFTWEQVLLNAIDTMRSCLKDGR